MSLAADRVYLASHITMTTGGLLPHPFTLYPIKFPCRVFYSLLHLPSDYSGHPLDGVPPHMQPGLSSRGIRHQLLPTVPWCDYSEKISNEYKQV